MSRWYKLVDKKPVCSEDRPDFENRSIGDYRVAKTSVGEAEISTVLLPFNHEWNPDKPPILFETLVFGGKHDQYLEQYSTYEQAEKGHERIVKMVKNI